MNLPSKLIITPSDRNENLGFHNYGNALFSHCLKLGFKPVESIKNRNLTKFVNLNFNFDESTIYQHVAMLSPFENSTDGNMELRTPFIWYTDLYNCKKADAECETFMIELCDVGRCKFTLFNLALAFIDQFSVIYIDSENTNNPILLTRSKIESYLNPVQIQSVA
jgi:hypothetical protein